MYAYPRTQNLVYPARVLSDEGALSRSDPSLDRAKAGRTGAPRNGRQADGQVERWEAQRLALGARGCLAARGGLTTPLQGCLASILAPPTAPSPRAGSRGTAKPRTHCAARTRKCGCLKYESEIRDEASSPRSFAGRGRRASSDARRVRGQALRTPDKRTIGSKGLQRSKHDPRVRRLRLLQRFAPHPKPSLRSGFDPSPQERGEVKPGLNRRGAACGLVVPSDPHNTG